MSYITTAERVGRAAGQRELVLRQLTRKCGELSADLVARISALSDEQLADLGDALLDFANADDLERWLNHTTSP
jgi:heme oxygenase